MDEISISSLLHIPDNVWSDLDLVMDDDEFDIMQRDMFDGMPSNDFIEIELPSHELKQSFLDVNDTDFVNVMSMEDHNQQQTTITKEQQSYHCISDHESPETVPSAVQADSDILNIAITSKVNVPAPQPYFPSISSSDLEKRMEQSISRLAMAMKRSEMSRQRIQENGIYKITASILS